MNTILEWQNSFSLFGVNYSGPKDGTLNPQFINAILNVETKYKAFGEILNGDKIIMTVSQAKSKFLNIQQDNSIKPPETKDDSEKLSPNSLTDKEEDKKAPTSLSPPDEDKQWVSFFNQNLPLIGKLYNGDLGVTAKNAEIAIGKLINKPMIGVIWNDQKKVFNTTQDDIKNALNLIQQHTQKQAKYTMDYRIMRLAEIFS